jgi:hypothetical protein
VCGLKTLLLRGRKKTTLDGRRQIGAPRLARRYSAQKCPNTWDFFFFSLSLLHTQATSSNFSSISAQLIEKHDLFFLLLENLTAFHPRCLR